MNDAIAKRLNAPLDNPPDWLAPFAMFHEIGGAAHGKRYAYVVTFWHGEYLAHVPVSAFADLNEARLYRRDRQGRARFQFFIWHVETGREYAIDVTDE